MSRSCRPDLVRTVLNRARMPAGGHVAGARKQTTMGWAFLATARSRQPTAARRASCPAVWPTSLMTLWITIDSSAQGAFEAEVSR
jgi:hypothetical protein